MKKALSNILFNKNLKILEIEFNWGRILSFVFFWSYGFMGSFTKPIGIINWLYSFFLIVIMLIVYGSSIKYKKQYSDTIKVSLQDLFIFLLFFCFLLVIGHSQLFKFLNGDQLAHSLISIGHSFKILFFMVSIQLSCKYLVGVII
jgi:hypothetical protein